MLKQCAWILFFGLFAVLVQHAFRVIHFLGYHVTVYNHFPGPCHLIPGVDHGSEDMETLPDGRTFITSGLSSPVEPSSFKEYYRENNIRGKVLYFDFKDPDSGVTELHFDEGFDRRTFYPHGISVIQEEGKTILFVVNHHPDADKIETFEFIEEKMMLQHKKSYTDDAVRHVNDVAAVSENSFYFTNIGYARGHFSFILELALFLPYGNVVFSDGAKYSVVADRLVAANGITLSKDKKNICVAIGGSMSVNIYKTKEDGSLFLLQEFPMYTDPDNILIEPGSGNLIIGTHPVGHLIAEHLSNPALFSPSKVVMIRMENGSHAVEMTELYSEDGAVLSASAVASIYNNNTVLVGSVFTGLLYCEVRYWPLSQDFVK